MPRLYLYICLSIYLFNYLSIYLHISLLFTYGCRVESMIPNVVLLVEVDEFLVVYKYIISILRYRVNIYQVIQVRGHWLIDWFGYSLINRLNSWQEIYFSKKITELVDFSKERIYCSGQAGTSLGSQASTSTSTSTVQYS